MHKTPSQTPERPNSSLQRVSEFETCIYGAPRPSAYRTYVTYDEKSRAGMFADLQHGDTKKLRFHIHSKLVHAAFRPIPFWDRSLPDHRTTSPAIDMSENHDEYSSSLYKTIRYILLDRYDIWAEHALKNQDTIPAEITSLFRGQKFVTQSALLEIIRDSFSTIGGGLSSGVRTTLRALSLGIRLYEKKCGKLPSHEEAIRIARSAYPIAIFITHMHQDTQKVFEYVLEKNPPEPHGPIEFRNTIDQWDESLFSLEKDKITIDLDAVLNKTKKICTPTFIEKHITAFNKTEEEAATFGCPGIGGIRDIFEYTLAHIPPSYTQNYKT